MTAKVAKRRRASRAHDENWRAHHHFGGLPERGQRRGALELGFGIGSPQDVLHSAYAPLHGGRPIALKNAVPAIDPQQLRRRKTIRYLLLPNSYSMKSVRAVGALV